MDNVTVDVMQVAGLTTVECLLCCKSVYASSSKTINYDDLKKFCVQLHRFVNYPHPISTLKIISDEEIANPIKYCVVCFELVTGFLKEFNLWEGAALLLHRRIQKLLQTLPVNGKNTPEPSNDTPVKNWRREVLLKSKHGQHNAMPRVSLYKVPGNSRSGTASHSEDCSTIINTACPDRSVNEDVLSVSRLSNSSEKHNNVSTEDKEASSPENYPSSPKLHVVTEESTNLEVKTEASESVNELDEEEVKHDPDSSSGSEISHDDDDIYDEMCFSETEDPDTPDLLQPSPPPKSFESSILFQLLESAASISENTITTSYSNTHQMPNSLSLTPGNSDDVQEESQNDTKYNLRKKRKQTYTEIYDESEQFSPTGECSVSKSSTNETIIKELSNSGDGNSNSNTIVTKSSESTQKCLSILSKKQKVGKVSCEICQETMSSRQIKAHFQEYHSTDDMDPTEIFRCNVEGCKAYFRTAQQKKEHRQIAHWHNLTPVICPVADCNRSFANQEQLQIHAKLHDTFKCKFCPEQVSYAPDLPIHEMIHVPTVSVNEKSFPCSRCKMVLKTEHLLSKHFLKFHLDLSLGSNQCNICQAIFVEDERSLQYHLEKVHGVRNVKENPPKDAVHCNLCPAFFLTQWQTDLNKMRDHWNSHCPECSYEPPRGNLQKWTQLRRHIMRNHSHLVSPYPFACSQCTQRFIRQESLDNHMEKMHTIQKLQCDKCDKTFSNLKRLAKHQSVTHGERSFVCSECGKAFKSKHYLLIHMEYHKPPEEWKFQCDICDKRFPQKDKLQSHHTTHTNEKAFVCQVCGVSYAHRHNWKAHMLQKHPNEKSVADCHQEKREGNYTRRKGSKKGDCVLSGEKQ